MKNVILIIIVVLLSTTLEIVAQNTVYANFKDGRVEYYYKDNLIETQYQDGLIVTYEYKNNCLSKATSSTGFYTKYFWEECRSTETFFSPGNKKIGIRKFKNNSLIKETYFNESGKEILKKQAEEIYNLQDNLKIY